MLRYSNALLGRYRCHPVPECELRLERDLYGNSEAMRAKNRPDQVQHTTGLPVGVLIYIAVSIVILTRWASVRNARHTSCA